MIFERVFERSLILIKKWSRRKIKPLAKKSSPILKRAPTPTLKNQIDIEEILKIPQNLHIDLENSTLKSAYENIKHLDQAKAPPKSLKSAPWSNCRVIFGDHAFSFHLSWSVKTPKTLIMKSGPWLLKAPQPKTSPQLKSLKSFIYITTRPYLDPRSQI